jgi:hypothetical protein
LFKKTKINDIRGLVLDAAVNYGCTVLTPDDSLMNDMVSATQAVRDDIKSQYPEFNDAVNAALERIGA